MTDDVQFSITLLHSGSHFPGGQVKGQVSVISTVSTRISNLRLVWRGIVSTEMNTTRDENTLFREVWYLDPKGTNSFALTPAPPNPRQIKVKKGIKDYAFDLNLKRNIPSSFEMNETVSLAKVEYILEAWAEIEGHTKPKRERIFVPVLATQHHQDTDAEEQQTRDATYIVTIPEVDHKEYRTASRITVPCKIAQRGVILPIVAHIWHDRDCTRPGGITLSLLRITTITCQHRQETLIREVETTTLDLDLVRRPEYSVQMLSESLRIPSKTLPSLDQSTGRLVNIEYRISLKVTIHDNAIYRLSEDESIAPNMLVDLPLTIDSNEIQDAIKPQSSSRTASVHSNNSNDTVSNRVRSLFRRRSNTLSRQGIYPINHIRISENLGVDDKLARQSSSRSSSPSLSSIDSQSIKPMPPPFTPIAEEDEKARRANIKSTPIPEFDTGVYTFQMFEDSSDEEYEPIKEEEEEEAKSDPPTTTSPPSLTLQNEDASPPSQSAAMMSTPPEIPKSSVGDIANSAQYWSGIFADQDSDGGRDGTAKGANEPRSPTTTATTTTLNPSSASSPPLLPISGPPAIEQQQQPYQDHQGQSHQNYNHLSAPPQYSDANNAKLDFISESDTDEHSDDSDEEPDLLSVVARREQRIERQKMRTIPNV